MGHSVQIGFPAWLRKGSESILNPQRQRIIIPIYPRRFSLFIRGHNRSKQGRTFRAKPNQRALIIQFVPFEWLRIGECKCRTQEIRRNGRRKPVCIGPPRELPEIRQLIGVSCEVPCGQEVCIIRRCFPWLTHKKDIASGIGKVKANAGSGCPLRIVGIHGIVLHDGNL